MAFRPVRHGHVAFSTVNDERGGALPPGPALRTVSRTRLCWTFDVAPPKA